MIIDNSCRVLTNRWLDCNDFIFTEEDGTIYYPKTYLIKNYIKNNDYINKEETIELIETQQHIKRCLYFKNKRN
jgi:hypothetical protein